MLVYLDSRDLIDLLEHERPCTLEEFRRRLVSGKHQLVVSFSNVRELSQPLFEARTSTIVTSLLNQLESMPLKYIREAYICPQEIEEALAAFSEMREYAGISPFVNRFDEACTPWNKRPATASYLNFSLAETVFMLISANPNPLVNVPRHGETLRALLEADRRLTNPPTLRENFPQVLDRHISQARLPVPKSLVATLANWIYDDPCRCPSVRLSYELYHSIRQNLSDVPRDADIPDVAHAGCIPYVDLITLDNRMRDYVRRVANRAVPGCARGVCQNLDDLLKRL
jgi:hypothetical protein